MSEATRRGCSGLLVSGGLALGAILLKEVLVPDALRFGLHEAGLRIASSSVEPLPAEAPLAAPPALASADVRPILRGSSGDEPEASAPTAAGGARVAPLELNPIEAAAEGWVLQAEALHGLSCARLALVRGWVYARHGYVFPDARTRREFRKQPGYRPDHAVNPDTIEGHLSAADRENRSLLLRLERRQGC